MIAPRPSVLRFASAVIERELARGNAASEATAAERVVARLRRELGRLIGPAGFDVLLARSLVLARRAYPVLARVTAGPGGTLAGLDDPAPDVSAFHEGSVALVAYFIELLATLIGEDLAMRLVRSVWPEEE